MKKVLTLALALAMVLSLFGCSGGSDRNQPDKSPSSETKKEEVQKKEAVKLRLTWLGDDMNKEKLDRSLKPFVDETGMEVETVYIPGTWEEYFTKIQTMVAGGEVVDNAYIAIEGFEMFRHMGLAQSVDRFVEKSEKNKEKVEELFSDVPKGVAAPFTMNGELFGFPTSYNNVVMHFNTKLLEEAGVELPQADWGMEEFLEICEKLTKELDGVKQYALSIPDGNFMIEAWLRNNGADFMTSDFTKSTINSPESIEIFQLFQDLVHKYGYAPIPEPNVETIQQLVDGKTAMGSWGRWPMDEYETNEFKDVALQYLPSFKENRIQFGVDGIFVTSKTEHYDEACELALYIAS
ncbi:MAG: extracellular solute-binding protein, partial [Firmicutes bacterium]|nr:extracellular solute-binding protein [Bacillota bacterium]